jgi:hypothetical protein
MCANATLSLDGSSVVVSFASPRAACESGKSL